MRSFRYVVVRSFAEATALLGEDAVALAGGTDLVPLMQERLATPRLVVDVSRVPGADEIVVSSTNGARIGALARLAELAMHPPLRRHYPALSRACATVGTAQIRNVGTLGGNLCQRPRCWYYRSGIQCWKTGSRSCPARDGANEYLAVVGGGPCWAPHPSDPAVALLALDAQISVRRSDGQVTSLSVEEFYAPPPERPDRETCLGAEDLIESISLPARHAGARQTYLKVMQRQTWDFALVSVAVVWPKRGRRPRIALGGVAPRPWRVASEKLPPAPRATARAEAAEMWAVNVANQALQNAVPLSGNAYKIDLAKSLIRRALQAKLGGR